MADELNDLRLQLEADEKAEDEEEEEMRHEPDFREIHEDLIEPKGGGDGDEDGEEDGYGDGEVGGDDGEYEERGLNTSHIITEYRKFDRRASNVGWIHPSDAAQHVSTHQHPARVASSGRRGAPRVDDAALGRRTRRSLASRSPASVATTTTATTLLCLVGLRRIQRVGARINSA